MNVPRPNRIISPHEMGLILSEVESFAQSIAWNVPGEPWDSIEGELRDAGYTPIEIEQVEREWKECHPEFERTPITEDVDAFGEGSFTIVPNFDGGAGDIGINLEIDHLHTEGSVALMVSVAEADRILMSLDRAIVQTGGVSHLAAESEVSWGARLVGTDRLPLAQIYEEVALAVSVDTGHVREALAAMLLSLSDHVVGGLPIPQIAFDLANDAIALEGELDRDG